MILDNYSESPMNNIERNTILERFDNDNALIEYVSEIFNIHIERLSVIEKRLNNSEIRFLSSNQSIIIINEKDVCFFDNDKDFQEYQNNRIFERYIIFQDILQDKNSNADEIDRYKNIDSLILLHDKNMVSESLCDEIKIFIDQTIKERKIAVDVWEDGNNVNCLNFNLDENYFKDSVEVKNLDSKIFKIISRVILILKEKYLIKSEGDSVY